MSLLSQGLVKGHRWGCISSFPLYSCCLRSHMLQCGLCFVTGWGIYDWLVQVWNWGQSAGERSQSW